MARANKRSGTRAGAHRVSRQRSAASRHDAIALLKADHRQVQEWFEQFEATRSQERKQNLATRICQALEVHTQIEEEIFYPAFLEATEEQDIHHEAEIEHEGAKKLVAEIEASGPDDEYFDARVSVLSEMIGHHVHEEEKRDGMFAKARKANMDLEELGERLAARKTELQGRSDNGRSRALGAVQRGQPGTRG